MATISGLHHINIRTTPDKVDATRDFYRDILGLHEGYRPNFRGPGYWMYAGDHPLVHISNSRATDDPVLQPESMDAGFGHIAFATTGYQALIDRLRAAGMDYEEHPTPDNDLIQVFFPDPNGVVCELVFDPAEVEAAKREAAAAE